MEKRKRMAAMAALGGMTVLGSVAGSCDLLETKQKGEIHILISESGYRATKSSFEIPDTNDFILEITSPSGETVYCGTYGKSCESYSIEEGICQVKVASGDMSVPSFDAPVFGDLQTVNVIAGTTTNVKLSCRQINSGLRMVRDKSFRQKYPGAVIEANGTSGMLSYEEEETRIGYFEPGEINLSVTDVPLTDYCLEKQTVLTLYLSVVDKPSEKSTVICRNMDIDTTRIWQSDTCSVGGPGKGESAENAMDIRQAKASIGSSGVWVYGYIVGGDMSGSGTGISFEGPFTSKTNLAIASRAQANGKSSCMSVQLPSGAIRDSLNLVDNPDNLGRTIRLKGDIVESYYGIPGIKNVTEYRF